MPKRKVASGRVVLLRCYDGKVIVAPVSGSWRIIHAYPGSRDTASPNALVEYKGEEYQLYGDVLTARAENNLHITLLPKTIKKHGPVDRNFVDSINSTIKNHATSEMAVGTFWAMVDEMDYVDANDLKSRLAKTASLIVSKLSEYNETQTPTPFLHPTAAALPLSSCETIVINCCLVSACRTL